MKPLLLFFLFIYGNAAIALHTYGSDITYKCVPGSKGYKYEVTLTYYHDCEGIPNCSGTCSNIGSCSKLIKVYGDEGAFKGVSYFTFPVYGVSVQDANYNPSCPDSKNICSNMSCITPGIFSPGIEKYIFKGIVDIGPNSGIPSSCCTVQFGFDECCRNSSIINMNAGNFYTYASLNRCIGFADTLHCSSPEYTNDPPFIMANGQGLIYNNGAIDADLDSLVYAFVPAMEGYGINATYVAPFSYDIPVPYLPPLTGNYPYGVKVDPLSGDFLHTPQSNGWKGTMVFGIEQWRYINGIPTKVGTTRRDFQTFIKSFAVNTSPSIRTIPAGIPILKPRTRWEVFVGDTLCFNVIAKDTDFNLPTVSDTTYLTWCKTLEKYGATFTYKYNTATRKLNGPREDSASVCWRPNDSHLIKGNATSYPFTISVRDSKCPIPGRIDQAMSIRVIPRVFDVNIIKVNHCNNVTLSYSQNEQSYSSVKWKVSKTPDVFDTKNLFQSTSNSCQTYFEKMGKYPVQLSVTLQNSSLTRIFYDTLVIEKQLRINNDMHFCEAPATILLQTLDTGFSKFKWYAFPDSTTILDTTNHFNFTINKPQTIYLTAEGKDSGCIAADTVHLGMSLLSTQIQRLGNKEQCLLNNSYSFSHISKDSFNYPLKAKWYFSNGDSSSLNTLPYHFIKEGVYTIKLEVIGTNGCSISTYDTLILNPTPVIGKISGFNNNLAVNTPYIYSVGAQNNHTYTWQITNGNVILGQGTNTITAKWNNLGIGNLFTTLTNSFGCMDTASLSVGIGILLTPEITFFTPSFGYRGDTIIIIGKHFTGALNVLFGGTSARSFKIISDTFIKAVVDYGSTGPIVVTTPNGTVSYSLFTYLTRAGINETKMLPHLHFYPNPSNSTLTFTNTDLIGNDAILTITDITGKTVFKEVFMQATVPISTLENGMYFLTVSKRDKTLKGNFIKN